MANHSTTVIDVLAASPVGVAVAAVLWSALGLYGLSALWWTLEATVLAQGGRVTPEDVRWGYDEVQVRILTVDAAAVVQATVDAVPDGIDDVVVVAETPMSIDEAAVRVVPESFECTATHKGRALEWARRHVACDREYVVYLDEDTIMTDFVGLPDADVVQFTELPLYTGSWVTYVCEVFRIGYQYEQFAFHRLRYPLYAWGGCLAVRASVEDAVTWDAATVTEDTNFLWRAAARGRLDFAVLDVRFRNQAPPSIRAMVAQRRRWISGTRADGGLLPRSYRPLYYTRIVAWAFSPLVPVFVVVSAVTPGAVPASGAYQVASLALFGLLFVYTSVGTVRYRKSVGRALAYVVATPVAFLAHSAGALWGVVCPVDSFAVTQKVAPETVESVNARLEAGDIEAHDGSERLVEERRVK